MDKEIELLKLKIQLLEKEIEVLKYRPTNVPYPYPVAVPAYPFYPNLGPWCYTSTAIGTTAISGTTN